MASPAWRGWLVLALAAMPVAPALAQEPEVLRPCRRADLIGLWQVVRFGFASGASVDRSNPAYQMHQRYLFKANATMTYTASAQPPGPDEHRALRQAPASETWALDATGRLMRQRPGVSQVDRSECRVVTRAVRDPRSKVPALAGDVLLTDQGADERPITRRLLRKVEVDE